MTTLVYIHGASATCESFNHIREHITSHKDLCLSYDSKNGFEENLKVMALTVSKLDNVFFVAHSLGGIYALHLANMFPEKVLGAVTLSTPYGGAAVADVVKYFMPFSRLMRDIGPSSWAMKQMNKITIQWPWTNVITVRGESPFMTEANDGVVTIASMMHLSNKMETVDLELNHYEVVISGRTIDIIKERLPAAAK